MLCARNEFPHRSIDDVQVLAGMSELDPVLALGRIEDLLAYAHHRNGARIEPDDQVVRSIRPLDSV